MKINILDVELDMPYDLTVPEDADKWEACVKELTSSLSALEKKKTGQGSLIREQIGIMKQWFNTVFGNNSDKKVFDGRENLKTVYIMLKIIQGLHLIYVPRILEDAWKDALKKYSPERAQRKK